MKYLIDHIISQHQDSTRMNPDRHIRYVLAELFYNCMMAIPGDVVEMGCYQGQTSIYIQSLLTTLESLSLIQNTKFHVYDSFSGLPDLAEQDIVDQPKFFKGQFNTTVNKFKEIFLQYHLKTPLIHKGWFKDIPIKDHPKKISFAFLDSDLYNSIIDSLNIVYPRLSTNGTILVHDYQHAYLPGVKKACQDFFADKSDIIQHYEPGIAKIVKMRYWL